MRKRKRAAAKLKAAKKQATLMAENSELSEKQKIKAISKAANKFRGEKSSKVYVTTRKTKAGSVGAMSGNGKVRQQLLLLLARSIHAFSLTLPSIALFRGVNSSL